MRRIINKLKIDAEKKNIFSNFIFLFLLQIANYLLPLLTVPYLVRTIGIANVGLLAFAGAVCTYFQIITDFGFNLSATRQVSINRSNKSILNEIYSSVIYIKIMLSIFCFIALLGLLEIVPQFKENKLVFILTYIGVFGQSLFPVWLFQGLERMRYITFINVGIKVLFTLSIFILINKPDDYIYVPALTSVSMVLSGIIAMLVIFVNFNISLQIVKFDIIGKYFKDGWHIFTSRVFSSLYKNSAVLILGFFTTHQVTGYYSVAEKIIRSLQTLQNVIGDALYPHLVKSFHDGKYSYNDFSRKYKWIVTIAYVCMALCVLVFSDIAAKIFVGVAYHQVSINIKIMSLIIFFGGLNYYYGILGLVALNYKKEFSRYVLITGIVSIISMIIFSVLYEDVGASIVSVLSEFLLLVLILNKLRKIKA
ncbi:TPA: flippase [Klebsiella pneumoniae]|uniref:Putative O-antigen transporter n=1 Tax=Klebsiella pneumoniae TaxID=573 RepID=A0A1C3SYZ7_KLEPN|nr:flippase [Klebsiella pneumoniae]ELA0533909.1 flippase [Klebsiella pneumoniae]ELA0877945.1 flippase [Klebsiella pneumoniae]EMB5919147.1 flippase [Klebsiella pneumoniae]MBS7758173.1 flippase [Klebsiella pneumoniae]MCJ6368412.1 flippase [Klebsiella pneumoniae]